MLASIVNATARSTGEGWRMSKKCLGNDMEKSRVFSHWQNVDNERSKVVLIVMVMVVFLIVSCW